MNNPDSVRQVVREQYGAAARGDVAAGPTCCAPGPQISSQLGYSEEEMAAVPDGANLGLGCGNPQAIASLKPGETVLDLGSGAGFDCFLAARSVGENGRVIGVDMTHDMLAKARQNAKDDGIANIEFRLGEIEHLPVADAQVDVILSNCVINLSPDKPQVFREAFRVLKPGGRLAISDVVAIADMPEALRQSADSVCACIGGAAAVTDITRWLEEAGFEQITVRVAPGSAEVISSWFPDSGAENYAASASIEAVVPGGEACCAPSCC